MNTISTGSERRTRMASLGSSLLNDNKLWFNLIFGNINIKYSEMIKWCSLGESSLSRSRGGQWTLRLFERIWNWLQKITVTHETGQGWLIGLIKGGWRVGVGHACEGVGVEIAGHVAIRGYKIWLWNCILLLSCPSTQWLLVSWYGPNVNIVAAPSW